MPAWTDTEVNLLGTDFDRVIAARIGRTEGAVCMARMGRGIPAFKPHQRKWKSWEVSLLGRVPDGRLAIRLGCSRKHIVDERRRRGIPAAPRSARLAPRRKK